MPALVVTLLVLAATPALAALPVPAGALDGTTVLVSASADGAPGEHHSSYPAVSENGRVIAFDSDAANLVPGDDAERDVFVKDTVTGALVRASTAWDGGPGNGRSGWPALSADGRVVAFESWATNLVPGTVDTPRGPGVFVRDLESGVTVHVSPDGGRKPAISADGRFVAFACGGVCLHDRAIGATERLVDETVRPGRVSVTGDGGHVYFDTHQALVVMDVNAHLDVYRVERATREVTLVSGPPTSLGGLSPDVTPDGRFVVMSAFPGQVPFAVDVLVLDTVTGETDRLPVAMDGYDAATISDDGRFVAFDTPWGWGLPADARTVAPTPHSWPGAWVWDRALGTVRLASHDEGAPRDGVYYFATLSGDGRVVAFEERQAGESAQVRALVRAVS